MHNQQLTEILHPKMTSIMDINDNYDNRLEREVTALKRENILLETQKTQLTYDLKRAHTNIAGLRLDIYTLACIVHEEFLANGSSFISPDSYQWFQRAFDVAGAGNYAFEKAILNLIEKYAPSK
jgi:hypothetical protein